MEKRPFGKTGLEVSVLGFGGAPIGLLDTSRQQISQILNQLLDDGVNLIDTAASYGGSEEAIGQAVGHRREEYILVSKCGQAFDDLEGTEWSPKVIAQTVDRALKRLQTDHLDVMLLHSCELEVLKQGDALGALLEAQAAGKVRFVGYSGDNEAAAFAAGLREIAVIETSVSLCDQTNLDVVLPVARENDVGVIAKRPLANAAWKDLGDQPGFYKEYAEPYTRRLAQMELSPTELGFDCDGSNLWPELALRFTLSHAGVHCAIVGTTDPHHVAVNFRSAERGALADECVLKVRQAFRTAEERSGERWPGLT